METDRIILDELQRVVLQTQVKAFIDAASDDDARAAYGELANAIALGEVPTSQSHRLGRMIGMLLSSGRIRTIYGPGTELSLWSLYQRTSEGRALLASVGAMNKALRPLVGQTLEFVGVTLRGPGVFALTLRTASLQMVIRFEQNGVRLESAELGSE